MTDPDRLLSQAEVAQRLGCSVKTVQRLRSDGRLSWIRAGGVKILASELERFIQRSMQRAPRKPKPAPKVMSFRELSPRARGRQIAARVLASRSRREE